VPIFNIQTIRKGAHLNFAMGATADQYRYLLLAPVSMYSYWIPNPRSFC